jgi:hypothetical protein
VTLAAVSGALLLADDHLLPLVEQGVGPDDVVNSVLGQRQKDVHDREWEQNVGVREDASHRTASVRETGVLHGGSDALPAGATTLTPSLEGQDVGQQHASMAAPREALGRDLSVVE